MKSSKPSSYNHSQSQSQGTARPARTDQQDNTEQDMEESEEIKRRIYVGGRIDPVIIIRSQCPVSVYLTYSVMVVFMLSHIAHN